MGLGCFAVPIVIVLVLAVLGFAVAAMFNGVAAAEMGGALLMTQIMQPLIALLGIGTGAGLILAAPRIFRAWMAMKGSDGASDELSKSEPVKALPSATVHRLPAPRTHTIRRTVRRRPRVRVDMDRLL